MYFSCYKWIWIIAFENLILLFLYVSVYIYIFHNIYPSITFFGIQFFWSLGKGFSYLIFFTYIFFNRKYCFLLFNFLVVATFELIQFSGTSKIHSPQNVSNNKKNVVKVRFKLRSSEIFYCIANICKGYQYIPVNIQFLEFMAGVLT